MARRRDFEGETRLARVRRARSIVRVLDRTYPDARCELDFTTPFELLVATVLSAQTTDRRVNAVTPVLFTRYPGPTGLAGASVAEVEEILRPIGFYRAKAQRVVALSAALVERFDSTVPGRLEDLVTLPGVGRKTANVVLGEGFGVPGITVDTHVGRLSRRLGLSRHEDPERVEVDLMDLLEKRSWTSSSQLLIWHGRRCCHARRPACGACPVAPRCPSFGAGPTDPQTAAALLRDEGPA